VLNAATKATTMKNPRINSFTPTMTKFARAVSRTPRESSSITAKTMKTAGRFRTPPSSRAVEIDFGNS
jgi:hypothetical protein